MPPESFAVLDETVNLTAEALDDDGKPLDYTDADGTFCLMCACGHRISGARPGDKVALCPNCQLLLMVVGPVTVKYEDRLPEDLIERLMTPPLSPPALKKGDVVKHIKSDRTGTVIRVSRRHGWADVNWGQRTDRQPLTSLGAL